MSNDYTLEEKQMQRKIFVRKTVVKIIKKIFFSQMEEK